MDILNYIYIIISIIGFNVNLFVIYCILIKIQKITSGDVFTLSLCFNNIFFLFFFVIQLFTNDEIQNFIISFLITLQVVNYFLIGFRSYCKVVLFKEIKINKAMKYILIFSICNIVIIIGFGIISLNYCMFNFNSILNLMWILPLTSITYFSSIWFYYEIYLTRNNSQTIVNEMISPRNKEKEQKIETKEQKIEEIENKNKIIKKNLSQLINRKMLKNIIFYLIIFTLQWIVLVIITILTLLNIDLFYLNIINVIWIFVLLINTILSSVIYGFANNKVREWFKKKPGKLRILINKLTERKMKVEKYINNNEKEDTFSPSQAIDSACGVHIIDMRGNFITEYKSNQNIDQIQVYEIPTLRINPDLSPPSSSNSSPLNTPSFDSSPEIHSPKSREQLNERKMNFKNLKPSPKQQANERMKTLRQISPNISHSPTDLRAIRVKNLIEQINLPNTLKIPIPNLISTERIKELRELNNYS